MTRGLSTLLILLLVFGCTYNEMKSPHTAKSNGLRLRGVSLKNFKEGEPNMSLIAEVLEYDKESQTIKINEGVIVQQMRFFSGIEDVKIEFNKGIYDLRSETIDISSVGGMLLNHNIKMSLSDIELFRSSGQISSKSTVRIEGKNFEFVGNGFIGNMKDGVYYFTDGIKARIFKL